MPIGERVVHDRGFLRCGASEMSNTYWHLDVAGANLVEGDALHVSESGAGIAKPGG